MAAWHRAGRSGRCGAEARLPRRARSAWPRQSRIDATLFGRQGKEMAMVESMALPAQGAEKGPSGRGKDASPRPVTPQAFMEAAAELERDRGEVRDRNAKLAWRLVGVFGGLALVSF